MSANLLVFSLRLLVNRLSNPWYVQHYKDESSRCPKYVSIYKKKSFDVKLELEQAHEAHQDHVSFSSKFIFCVLTSSLSEMRVV